jgi:cysteinyl-tRNA synthetase
VSLRIYNTAKRQEEDFEPIREDKIGLYVCGPTVYDFAHVGNARPVVVFDVLYRLLKHLYEPKRKITYVRNITDVDDKINAAAKEQGVPISAITEKTTRAYHEDMTALGALPPDVEPRATGHIAEMIAMIEALIAKGHAYAAEGHVLFSVASMADYGKLSGRSTDELIAGARVEVAPYKRDPGDFVLWKPSSPDLPGWDSPWGRGRPGWHIECSAMSEKHLGVSFDIHGGGRDLIFPHHENEVAQSVSAHDGKPFAKYWVHNGFVTVNGEKMSKSLGNFRTVRDLLARAPGEAIRLVLLKTHYRQPLDFSDDALKEAKANLDRWYRALEMFPGVASSNAETHVLEALEDDLNTSVAIAKIGDLVDGVFGLAKNDPEQAKRLVGWIRASGLLLGLLQQDPEAWFKWQPSSATGLSETAILSLIEARNAARKVKDFAEADRIRRELADGGVVLEDKAGGKTEWRRAG